MKPWLGYALVTTLFFGVWGALIELPEKAGFPATLGYSVWALTMIPCAVAALRIAGWRLETDGGSILFGSLTGLTGAGGQLLLFEALRWGPAWLVFPLVSLYPVLTVVLSASLLRERTTRKGVVGILLAVPAIVLLSWQPPASVDASGGRWLPLAALVFVLWGVQAFIMKWANNRMRAESIFFYMAATALTLIPVAIFMTDWSRRIEWGFRGPWLAALIQILNSIGALTLVYALRYGKAIIVVPMTALAPLLTVLISLAIYGNVPTPVLLAGMAFAAIAMVLLAE